VRGTVITYVNPAVAAVLGVFVLNESFGPAMAIGFGLVIVGSTLATRRPRAVDDESRRAGGDADRPGGIAPDIRTDGVSDA
ncbi:MAG: EamA family transporter, partial [Candidatus Limnocylindrales bacterium]